MTFFWTPGAEGLTLEHFKKCYGGLWKPKDLWRIGKLCEKNLNPLLFYVEILGPNETKCDTRDKWIVNEIHH